MCLHVRAHSCFKIPFKSIWFIGQTPADRRPNHQLSAVGLAPGPAVAWHMTWVLSGFETPSGHWAIGWQYQSGVVTTTTKRTLGRSFTFYYTHHRPSMQPQQRKRSSGHCAPKRAKVVLVFRLPIVMIATNVWTVPDIPTTTVPLFKISWRGPMLGSSFTPRSAY